MKNKKFSIILFAIIFFPLVLASSVDRNFEFNEIEVGEEFKLKYNVNPTNAKYFAVDEIIPVGFEVARENLVQSHLRFFSSSNSKEFTIIAPDIPGNYTFSGGQYQVYGDDNWYFFQAKSIRIVPICTDKDKDSYGSGCLLGEDCNDENEKINPGVLEICDNIDNNCNNQIDENNVCSLNIKLNYPKNPISNEKRSIFNLTINQEVEELRYIDYSDKRPRIKSLCRNCNEYGNTKTKAKSLNEGFHNLTFIASKYYFSAEKSASFFIDATKPKIKNIYPKKGYSNSSFIVEYQEENPKQITLHYGNNRLARIDCPFNSEEKIQICEFNVNMSEYNSQSTTYWFEIEDVAGNKARTKETEIFVDLTKPIINKLNYSIESRKVHFYIEISEKVDLEYYDENEKRPRWKSLCRKCDAYDRKKSFSLEEHNLTIKATDKAGNSEEKKIDFII